MDGNQESPEFWGGGAMLRRAREVSGRTARLSVRRALLGRLRPEPVAQPDGAYARWRTDQAIRIVHGPWSTEGIISGPAAIMRGEGVGTTNRRTSCHNARGS